MFKNTGKSKDGVSMHTSFETTRVYLQKVDNPEGPDASWYTEEFEESDGSTEARTMT
jgi:hypothetical protein